MNETTAEITISKRGSALIVSLDRVRALNALTPSMIAGLTDALPKAARNPDIYCVVLTSSSAKAFSAGGDVRALIETARTDKPAARKALADEYSFNWLHECFSKPTCALIGGMVMGSGVGISAYGTHRVAGANYRFAMPETAIGLFPDVGAAWVLARLPEEAGTYLGLTGRSIRRADAFALGLVSHCIEDAEFPAIVDELADTQPIDPILNRRHVHPGAGELAPLRGLIQRCFSADTIEDILARLSSETGEHKDWAAACAAELKTRSPLSLKVTLRHLREARALDLRQTLQVDYRLACRFLDGHDFAEGVRAALVDKDGKPRWEPERLDDVSADMVDDYFADLGACELVLPTRIEMQTARV